MYKTEELPQKKTTPLKTKKHKPEDISETTYSESLSTSDSSSSDSINSRSESSESKNALPNKRPRTKPATKKEPENTFLTNPLAGIASPRPHLAQKNPGTEKEKKTTQQEKYLTKKQQKPIQKTQPQESYQNPGLMRHAAQEQYLYQHRPMQHPQRHSLPYYISPATQTTHNSRINHFSPNTSSSVLTIKTKKNLDTLGLSNTDLNLTPERINALNALFDPPAWQQIQSFMINDQFLRHAFFFILPQFNKNKINKDSSTKTGYCENRLWIKGNCFPFQDINLLKQIAAANGFCDDFSSLASTVHIIIAVLTFTLTPWTTLGAIAYTGVHSGNGFIGTPVSSTVTLIYGPPKTLMRIAAILLLCLPLLGAIIKAIRGWKNLKVDWQEQDLERLETPNDLTNNCLFPRLYWKNREQKDVYSQHIQHLLWNGNISEEFIKKSIDFFIKHAKNRDFNPQSTAIKTLYEFLCSIKHKDLRSLHKAGISKELLLARINAAIVAHQTLVELSSFQNNSSPQGTVANLNRYLLVNHKLWLLGFQKNLSLTFLFYIPRVWPWYTAISAIISIAEFLSKIDCIKQGGQLQPRRGFADEDSNEDIKLYCASKEEVLCQKNGGFWGRGSGSIEEANQIGCDIPIRKTLSTTTHAYNYTSEKSELSLERPTKIKSSDATSLYSASIPGKISQFFSKEKQKPIFPNQICSATHLNNSLGHIGLMLLFLNIILYSFKKMPTHKQRPAFRVA